jgi:hypothetical protein
MTMDLGLWPAGWGGEDDGKIHAFMTFQLQFLAMISKGGLTSGIHLH